MNGNGRWGITARVSGRGIETLRIFPHPEERGEPEPTCHVALRKWGRLDLVTSCFGMAAEALPVGVLKGAHDFAAICELVETHRLERPAGTVEVFEGDPCGQVYFVVSGWLAASKAMADGHRQIVDIVLAGGMLDPASAGCDREHCRGRVADPRRSRGAAPRKLVSVARPSPRGPATGPALRENGGWCRACRRECCGWARAARKNRVAYALCELCLRSSGAGLEEHRPYHIPMNQPLLGDFCGLSSVHVVPHIAAPRDPGHHRAQPSDGYRDPRPLRAGGDRAGRPRDDAEGDPSRHRPRVVACVSQVRNLRADCASG